MFIKYWLMNYCLSLYLFCDHMLTSSFPPNFNQFPKISPQKKIYILYGSCITFSEFHFKGNMTCSTGGSCQIQIYSLDDRIVIRGKFTYLDLTC